MLIVKDLKNETFYDVDEYTYDMKTEPPSVTIHYQGGYMILPLSDKDKVLSDNGG